MYAHMRIAGDHVPAEALDIWILQAFGSGVDFISFKAALLFPPSHPLYLASYLYSRCMPHRHGSFLVLGHEMRPS